MLRHTLCIWQRGFGSVSGQCQSAKKKKCASGRFFFACAFSVHLGGHARAG